MGTGAPQKKPSALRYVHAGRARQRDPVNGLLDDLRTYPGLLVAFSAGVDSAFLLAASLRALGPERVLAVTAVSDSLPAAELDYARRFTAEVGAQHLEASTNELDRDGYRQNGTDRCYFCKAELMDVVSGHLDRLAPGARVATGTNADDLVAGFRPGIRAAAQRRAVTPLADAGLTKEQIRAQAQAWGLTVWGTNHKQRAFPAGSRTASRSRRPASRGSNRRRSPYVDR